MVHHTAKGLASLGRHGDSMLVHMSPEEIGGLQALGQITGHKLHTNPHTGMPEAFDFGDFFSSFLPTIAGMAFAPATGGFSMAPILAGAATGAGLAAIKGNDVLMGGLTGGLGGYGGGKMGPAFGAASGANAPIKALEGTLPNIGGAGAADAIGTNVLQQTPLYQGGLRMVAPSSLAEINAQGVITQAGQGLGSSASGASAFNPIENLSKSFSGMKNVAGFGDMSSADAFNAFKGAGGSGTHLAMTGAGAVLGGLEPSDLYGKPMKPSDKDKYDPYATLNLNNDTGLRLLAGGGAIYDNSDNTTPANLSRDGFGVGRLNNLAGEQAKSQAETYGYAGGGAIAFADGGDPTDKTTMDLALPETTQGIAALPAAQPTEQGPTPGQMAAMAGMQAGAPQEGSSIIEQVAFKMQQDPNYQPQNPIEESIVKQLKGTDPMQEGQPSQQGLGSLGPVEPSFPKFNETPAMGPTYYAGMNAPRGFAEGGETSMNLDDLPSLNVNTGEQGYGGKSYYMTPDGKGMYAGRFFKDVARQNPNINPLFKLLSRLPDDRVFTRQMAHGGYLNGDGDGMSDSIPATIEGKQPARLADGEFVVPADVVSHLGNGSSKAGSKRLYKMLDKVRHARTGTKKQGREINPNKYMPA